MKTRKSHPVAMRLWQPWLLCLLWLLWLLTSTASLAEIRAPIIEGARAVPVQARNGMVVTSHYIATQEALQILESGGNAIDAAVAAGFVLAVVQPRSGNIGGGGFMLVSMQETGQVEAVDYRETAPARAHRNMFLGQDGQTNPELSQFSHMAAGVPGTVAGLLLALERYGSLTRAQVLEPAIRLAEKGFEIPQRFADGIAASKQRLLANPAARRLFFKPDGSMYQPGDRFRQPDLAASLKRIASDGKAGFYEGETARLLVAEMQRGNGLISLGDLKSYEARIRKPVTGHYRGHTIYSMSPPSSGGTHIVQMLNMLEPYPVREWGLNSARSIHLLTEVMKRAYADRAQHMGDTDFVQVPLQGLTSTAYARHLNKGLDLTRITPADQIRAGKPAAYESEETTHFSIVDREGNAVSNTYTINFSYGSHIAVEGAGFLLNNEMDDFSAQAGVPNAYGLIGGDANSIEPRKRMLSSMSPTIVTYGGRNRIVTGTPGGSRIISTTLQILLNVIDHGLNIQEAVNEPRIHHQWQPDTLQTESGLSPDTLMLLERMGHQIKQGSAMGAAQSIVIEADGRLFGGADPRRETSLAAGY